ncbi:hypothetical protein HMI56_002213 [Coelomomyces lativittatus]|nr:hypothetical protein HMI56_002213 [Coelomomyces lativittatus]
MNVKNLNPPPASWKMHFLELHESLARSEAQVSLLSHQVYLLSNELHQSNERMTETARQLRAFERQMLEKGLR